MSELFEDLQVVVTTSRDAVRIRVRGELDMGSVGVLRDVLEAAVAAGGADDVEVDMSATSFCDSVGLCVLAAARQQLEERGRRLSIVDASRSVRRVLDLSGMAPLFGAIDAAPC
jgi:anti-anti-sigma factor